MLLDSKVSLANVVENYPYQEISNAAVFKQYTSDYQALHRLHLNIYNDLATNKIHFEKMAEYLKGSTDVRHDIHHFQLLTISLTQQLSLPKLRKLFLIFLNEEKPYAPLVFLQFWCFRKWRDCEVTTRRFATSWQNSPRRWIILWPPICNKAWAENLQNIIRKSLGCNFGTLCDSVDKVQSIIL